MNKLYFAPSFYSHAINGFFILFALYYVYKYYANLKQLDHYKMLVLILLFAILFGLHGLSHLGLEVFYGFNPLTTSS